MRTHVRTEHTWGNIPPGKSSISFMAFSGKVSSSPINRPHHHHQHFHHISICISFWFTSENDPLQPINFVHPPTPIASHRGIIGANWGAGSLPRRYQIRLLQLDFRRALNLSVGYNKPGRGGKKLPPAKFCVKFAREGRKTGKWDTSVKQINRIRPPP